MRYPIAIEPGDDKTAWGVVVPDLPGCFSAGDTMDDALDQAREAIEAWVDAVLDDGGDVPAPSALEALRNDPEYSGWIWAVVEVDPAAFSGQAERINISVPARLLRRIDAAASAAHSTRSGFLIDAALEAIRQRGTASSRQGNPAR